MTAAEVLEELKGMGSESIKKIYLKHGAKEPFFGVRVGDMKTILKREKGNQALAMALYDTGNSDAMYLAGLMADGSKMTRDELNKWVRGAYWYMLSEFTVPWVTAENPAAEDLAEEWMQSPQELIATAGWYVYTWLVSIKKNEELNLPRLKELLQKAEKEIHGSPNRVRQAMNQFVINVGAYVRPLHDEAMHTAKRIGKVHVDMGDTSCKVPYAPDYILKSVQRGTLDKKRKHLKC
jgi:3-methyladenine DNA glycosylase AlkD